MPQQSRADAHVAPVVAQQVHPDRPTQRHVRPVQHWLGLVHVVVAARHCGGAAQCPDWQVRPAQHGLAPAQVAPAAPHVGGSSQTVPRQTRPVQHWLFSAQGSPIGRHAAVHRPLTQVAPPQHSRSAAQGKPGVMQARQTLSARHHPDAPQTSGMTRQSGLQYRSVVPVQTWPTPHSPAGPQGRTQFPDRRHSVPSGQGATSEQGRVQTP